MAGVSAGRLCQPVVVDRYAHRNSGVQVDAQDFDHRPELLFRFRINPDAVLEVAPLLILISFLSVFGSARLLRTTCVAFYGDRSLRGRDMDV
jgi:hypothetical protein